MKKFTAKLIGIVAMILFISLMPITVFASNEDISIINTMNNQTNQGYIIYIKGISTQNFKYAFTNNENADPNVMDLSFINSISDLGENGNQVAFLDAETYDNLTKDENSEENKTIYIWAKDENENLILEGIQLDLSNSLTSKEIENVENLTSNIEVKIADNMDSTTEIKNEVVDGVEETTNVGYVQILDDKNAEYWYEMVKLPSTDSYNNLEELALKIQNEYDSMEMYEKIKFVEEFNEKLANVADQAKWNKVENMMIKQPEESKENDRYIVLLKKVANGETTLDIQFLTADEKDVENKDIVKVATEETTRLPITYDSIALFVVLGIIAVLVIVIFIRMKKISKKNEEK